MNDLHDKLGEQPAELIDDSASEQLAESPVDFSAEIETLEIDGLAKALGFDGSEVEEPETLPEDGEQPSDIVPELPLEQKPANNNRRRLSTTGLADADRDLTASAIAMVRDGKASSILEAIQSLTSNTEHAGNEQQPSDGENPTNDQLPNAPQTLIDLEARFEQANEEMADAIREFDQDKQVALNKEIALLNRQILKAEQAEEQASKQAHGWEQNYQAAVERMEEKYAELLDDDTSPFADWLDDKVAAAKSRNDPAMRDPNFILQFADEIAAYVKPASASTKTPAPLPPRPLVTMGSNVAPSNKSKAQLTTRQSEQYIQQASADVLEKALWG